MTKESKKQQNKKRVIVYYAPGVGARYRTELEITQIEDAEAEKDDLERWYYKDGLTDVEFSFYAFKDSLNQVDNPCDDNPHIPTDKVNVAAVNLALPNFFFKNYKKGFKYQGQFLLKPRDYEFLNTGMGDHGQYGCPSPPGGGNDDGKMSKDGKADQNKKPPFEFNGNYFHPMIMPNWQVCFHITEQSDYWKDYDPCCHNVSVDFPIQYDTTLGLFFTREVSFPDKLLKGDEFEKCRKKKRTKKIKELIDIICPDFTVEKVNEVLDFLSKLKK